MATKARAIGIDELSTVIAKPTASPTADEMAIRRHFGEIKASRFDELALSRFAGFVASREVDFIGAPVSSMVLQIPSSI
jgi:hypothetical protein